MTSKPEPTYKRKTPYAFVAGSTKYAKVLPSEPLILMIDAGNSEVKAMIHGHFGEEIVFPHSVRYLTESDWGSTQQSYKGRSSILQGTAIFETKRGRYTVGLQAQQSAEGVHVDGPKKYGDHMRALVEAAMLMLYPEDHDNVQLFVMHPAKLSEESGKRLIECVIGPHVIKLADGRKIRYTVRNVYLQEEAVGSLHTWLLTTEGKMYQARPLKLQPGDTILMFEIGGWISYIGYATVNDNGGIEPNTQDAVAIQAGIQTARNAFQDALKDTYKHLDTIQNLPDWFLYRALYTRTIDFDDGFGERDCSAEADKALGVMRLKFERTYTDQFSEGLGTKMILVGGGGGGLSFDYFKRTLFAKRERVYPVESKSDRMRFSPIRGASKAALIFFPIRNHKSLEVVE